MTFSRYGFLCCIIFYGFCIILRFFLIVFLHFQYFFGFSNNFMIFITFFVISQVVINNIIERVFVLYISTFILCCILLDRSNIVSINNIKITRLESKLWFLILLKTLIRFLVFKVMVEEGIYTWWVMHIRA